MSRPDVEAAEQARLYTLEACKQVAHTLERSRRVVFTLRRPGTCRAWKNLRNRAERFALRLLFEARTGQEWPQ